MDDFSKYSWPFPITCKYDVFIVFSQYKVMVETFLNCNIKAVQIGGGGWNCCFTNFFCLSWISHCKTCPHTHHQNGNVERKHIHIVDTGLSSLAYSHVPFKQLVSSLIKFLQVSIVSNLLMSFCSTKHLIINF